MSRVVVVALFVLLGIPIADAAHAARRLVRQVNYQRGVVVVNRGWPLKRPLRVAYVRPARSVVRVAPAVFLAPLVFLGVPLKRAPLHDAYLWEDSEVLDKVDDWTEFTLNCDSRGQALYFEIASGKAQLDWAEVVFENGDTQVIDFAEKNYGPGIFALLDFKDGRKVDHVRTVARARTDETKMILRMAR